MLTGRTVAQAMFLASTPISSVKEEVYAAAAIPVWHQRLIWQNEVLADDCTLGDLALPAANAALVLVVSLPAEELIEEARRLVMEAAASLDVLDARAFSELKNLHMPPAVVGAAFEALMQLLAGIDPLVEVDSKGRLKDRSWNASRKMIKDPKKLLSKLHDFPRMIDSDRVPARNIQAACAIRDSLGVQFTYGTMRMSSQAAAGVVAWITSILRYHDVVCKIRADFEGFDIMTEIRERLDQ